MKFTLTRSEIEALIRKEYNLPANCLIDVELTSPLYDKIKTRLATEAGMIPRVKALREIAYEGGRGFTLGLGDAKWAIEHYDSFMEFIKTNNRWPLADYSKREGTSYITDYQ